jgi:hypothetical protein
MSSEIFPRALSSHDSGEMRLDFDISSFLLPSREAAAKYLLCYFEHASITYWYLDRPRVENLLDQFYQDVEAVVEDHSSVALLFIVMAHGRVPILNIFTLPHVLTALLGVYGCPLGRGMAIAAV